MNDDDRPLETNASAKAWIGSLFASLILIGGFLYYRDVVRNPAPNSDSIDTESEVGAKSAKRKKRGKKRRGKSTKRRGTTDAPEREEVWENDDDFVADDSMFGNVFNSRDEREDDIEPEIKELPPYVPKKSEYQASGRYRPTAKFVKPGASTSQATVINMGDGSGDSSSLRSDQIRSTMKLSRLMPCYRRWVDKIPQMSGRVNFQMVVETNGRPSVVKITESGLRSRVVEKCLVNKAKQLRFPKTSAPSKFSTHFSFSN